MQDVHPGKRGSGGDVSKGNRSYLVPYNVIPYGGKFLWDKIFMDFVVGLTSVKLLSAN